MTPPTDLALRVGRGPCRSPVWDEPSRLRAAEGARGKASWRRCARSNSEIQSCGEAGPPREKNCNAQGPAGPRPRKPSPRLCRGGRGGGHRRDHRKTIPAQWMPEGGGMGGVGGTGQTRPMKLLEIGHLAKRTCRNAHRHPWHRCPLPLVRVPGQSCSLPPPAGQSIHCSEGSWGWKIRPAELGSQGSSPARAGTGCPGQVPAPGQPQGAGPHLRRGGAKCVSPAQRPGPAASLPLSVLRLKLLSNPKVVCFFNTNT